jgi:hypothetical protein
VPGVAVPGLSRPGDAFGGITIFGKETLPAAKEREHLERRIPARHGKGDSDWNYN